MIISPGFFHSFEIYIFWAVRGVKGQKIAQNEKYQLHLSCTISRSSIAYDHEFWYTCVKWWYLELFFNFFYIFIFLAVGGVKGQKIAQKNNNYIHHAPYLRNSIAYDHALWYISVKGWYLQVLFSILWYFHFSGC